MKVLSALALVNPINGPIKKLYSIPLVRWNDFLKPGPIWCFCLPGELKLSNCPKFDIPPKPIFIPL